MKAFAAFKVEQTRFIAIRNPQGLHIVNDAGQSYGVWASVDSFKDCLQKGIATASPEPYRLTAAPQVALSDRYRNSVMLLRIVDASGKPRLICPDKIVGMEPTPDPGGVGPLTRIMFEHRDMLVPTAYVDVEAALNRTRQLCGFNCDVGRGMGIAKMPEPFARTSMTVVVFFRSGSQAEEFMDGFDAHVRYLESQPHSELSANDHLILEEELRFFGPVAQRSVTVVPEDFIVRLPFDTWQDLREFVEGKVR